MSTVRVNDKEYEFDFGNPSNREVMKIERVFRKTFKEWAEEVRKGSVTALTVLVWMLQSRDNPHLKFEDVEFKLGDFDVEGDEEEEQEDDAEQEALDPTSSGADPAAAATPSSDIEAGS